MTLGRLGGAILRVTRNRAHNVVWPVALIEFVALLGFYEGAVLKVLLGGLPMGEWHDLNLFRKVKGGRKVAVAINKDAPDHEHRLVWRGYLLHPLKNTGITHLGQLRKYTRKL
jgi:hypothetical protein